MNTAILTPAHAGIRIDARTDRSRREPDPRTCGDPQVKAEPRTRGDGPFFTQSGRGSKS